MLKVLGKIEIVARACLMRRKVLGVGWMHD